MYPKSTDQTDKVISKGIDTIVVNGTALRVSDIDNVDIVTDKWLIPRKWRRSIALCFLLVFLVLGILSVLNALSGPAEDIAFVLLFSLIGMLSAANFIGTKADGQYKAALRVRIGSQYHTILESYDTNFVREAAANLRKQIIEIRQEHIKPE